MPRHQTKTYGRPYTRHSVANKAFDDIFSDKSNPPMQARGTIHKWGKTSFTSGRTTPKDFMIVEPKVLITDKKEKPNGVDPFSFESDDDPNSLRKSPRLNTDQPLPKVDIPVIGLVSNVPKEKVEEEQVAFTRRAIKTYSRSLSRADPSEAESTGEDTLSPDPPQVLRSKTTNNAITKPPVKVEKKDNANSNIWIEATKVIPSITVSSDSTDYSRFDIDSKPSDISSSAESPYRSDENRNIGNRSTPSKREFWEKRNSYKTTTVLRQETPTNQYPRLKKTLTVIRVSPPRADKNPVPIVENEYEFSTPSKENKDILSAEHDRALTNSDTEQSDAYKTSAQRVPRICKFFRSRNAAKENSLASTVLPSVDSDSDDKTTVAETISTSDSIAFLSEFSPIKYGSPLSQDSNGENDDNKSDATEENESSQGDVKSETDSIDVDIYTNNEKQGIESSSVPSRYRNIKSYSRESVSNRIFKSKSSDSGSGNRLLKRTSTESSSGPSLKKIFSNNSPQKSAFYNPRPWTDDDEEGGAGTLKQKAAKQDRSKAISLFDDLDEEEGDKEKAKPKLVRTVVWPTQVGDEAITQLHVNKQHKELFTVVRNVKEAHECQEFGETQEFMDDVEYLLTGIRDSETVSMRCLSCLSLSQKCIEPGFRMHLRAHGIATKVFHILHDANTNPSLALCTAALLYLLSQDRLKMELDSQTLKLVLKLMGVDGDDSPSRLSSGTVNDLNRNRQRLREQLETLQKSGGAKHLDLNNLSATGLALESLLSLTSQRAAPKFKEDLRTQGALDHIVDCVCGCVDSLSLEIDDGESLMDHLNEAHRCLQVLENVSYLNTENQKYLIAYRNGSLVVCTCRLLQLCEQNLSDYPVELDLDTQKPNQDTLGWAYFSCSLAILRLLLNITHDNEWGCTKVGEQNTAVRTIMLCVLYTAKFVPVDQRFDLLVLGLGLLINLVEHCDINRRVLFSIDDIQYWDVQEDRTSSLTAVQALVQLFMHREEAARLMEDDVGADVMDESLPSTSKAGMQGRGGKNGKSPHPIKTYGSKSRKRNESGHWKESNSGIEWVVIPMNENDDSQSETPFMDITDDEIEEIPLSNSQDDDDDTFTKALHRAGKHMEDSIVAAYVALLIGCVVQDTQDYVDEVKSHLLEGDFEPMVRVLNKFLGFMNLTSAIGSTGGKSISRVIEILESC